MEVHPRATGRRMGRVLGYAQRKLHLRSGGAGSLADSQAGSGGGFHHLAEHLAAKSTRSTFKINLQALVNRTSHVPVMPCEQKAEGWPAVPPSPWGVRPTVERTPKISVRPPSSLV